MLPDEPPDSGERLPHELMAAAAEALAGEPADRDAALAALCRAHPGHAARLQRMFVDFAGVERLLADGYGGSGVVAAELTQFGPYRVIRRLGDGAFGEVFLCEQREPVRRNVAVKVLRAGAGDKTTLLRFAAERQLIASLQHPAIAQVFDAGTLPDGRPFFVMDAIDGLPIDRHCDEHHLTVDARIELFCELCRGVQHAHERGIVHRDLKPANVLVVEIDGRPRPKVIDFGIAKVLQSSRVARSFDTEAGRVVGTPGYMSPEQQKGASDDVDARADVFSLGVMLYELLCGQLPWTIGAAATDTDPARPSTRVSGTSDVATAIARDRSTQPRRLASRLRGDLDWIVLKCLHRDRSLRYASALELVEDLERHRRAEPVRAGPPSTTYRLRRFVRRHRSLVVAFAGAAIVAAGGAGLYVSLRSSADAEIVAARSQAESAFATATEAVERLFERANDPSVREAPAGDATRKAMLQDALSFYDRFLVERPSDPKLRANRCSVLLRLARVQVLLGDAEKAGATASMLVQEAEALWQQEPANQEIRGLLGQGLGEAGAACSLLGKVEGARTAFRAAIVHLAASAQAMPGRFGIPYAVALRSAAAKAPVVGDERETSLRESLRVLDGLVAVAPAADVACEYVQSACELGSALAVDKRLAESDAVLQQAAARLPLVEADRLHLTCRVNSLRADVAFQGGERRSTIEHYRAALAAVVSWQEAQPQRLLPRVVHARALRALGYAQNYAGDFADSVASYREAIAICDESTLRFPAVSGALEQALLMEEFALTLLDRFDRGVLTEAWEVVERAAALEKQASGDGPSERRWRFACLRASIADARAPSGGDRYWPDVESALAVEPPCGGRETDLLIGAYVSLSRWHFDHGRVGPATAWLGKASAVVATDPKEHGKRAVETGWLSARLAALRSDYRACAAAADAVLAARKTWYGRLHAADCLRLAWKCAHDDAQDETAAAGYRARALEEYRLVKRSLDADVEKDPTDPWFVVPWGVAGVRIAELSADADATGASAMLAAVLPRLEQVRERTLADQWNEQAWRDGRALRDEIAPRGR